MWEEATDTIRFAGAGVDLMADAMGPRHGMPIQFLHEGGQLRQSWGCAVAFAVRRGYQALTHDLRGRGGSGWARNDTYVKDGFADDVRAVMGGASTDAFNAAVFDFLARRSSRSAAGQ